MLRGLDVVATSYPDLMNDFLALELLRGFNAKTIHRIFAMQVEGVITKDNLTNRVFRFVFNIEYQVYCCIMLATFELKQFCVIRIAYVVCIPKILETQSSNHGCLRRPSYTS